MAARARAGACKGKTQNIESLVGFMERGRSTRSAPSPKSGTKYSIKTPSGAAALRGSSRKQENTCRHEMANAAEAEMCRAVQILKP